jgi:hypothetical protein
MNKNGLLSIGIAIFACASLAPSAAHAWSVTATGTIVDSQADPSPGDGMGIFGLSDPSSLVGLSYTETITTNPLLNGIVSCGTTECEAQGGSVAGIGIYAAPYTVSVTVNGVTFTETETTPDTNWAFLSDALSTNNTSITNPGVDQLYQSVVTNCSVVGRNCTSAAIDAFGTTIPFVSSLSFNQNITAGPFPSTNGEASFDYQAPDGDVLTQFSGTIDTLSVNSRPVGVPEPGSLLLMGLGIAATLGVMRLKGHSGALIKNSGEL